MRYSDYNQTFIGDSFKIKHKNTIIYEKIDRYEPHLIAHNLDHPFYFISFSKNDRGYLIDFKQKDHKPLITNLNFNDPIIKNFTSDFIEDIKILITKQNEIKTELNVTELHDNQYLNNIQNLTFSVTDTFFHNRFAKQIVNVISLRSNISIKFYKEKTKYSFMLLPFDLSISLDSSEIGNRNITNPIKKGQKLSMKNFDFKIVNFDEPNQSKLYFEYKHNKTSLNKRKRQNIQISDILNFNNNLKKVSDKETLSLIKSVNFINSDIIIENFELCEIDKIYIYDNIMLVICRDRKILGLYEIIDYNSSNIESYIFNFNSHKLKIFEICSEFVKVKCVKKHCCKFFSEYAAINYLFPHVLKVSRIYMRLVNCILKGKQASIDEFIKIK
ncbi:hypothetical protein GVAV_001652 [Gurleya vavrai]